MARLTQTYDRKPLADGMTERDLYGPMRGGAWTNDMRLGRVLRARTIQEAYDLGEWALQDDEADAYDIHVSTTYRDYAVGLYRSAAWQETTRRFVLESQESGA